METNGRVCAVCGKALQGQQRVVCGGKCANRRAANTETARRKAIREKHPKPPLPPQACMNCGTLYQPHHPAQIYCSMICGQDLRARRRRERRRRTTDREVN